MVVLSSVGITLEVEFVDYPSQLFLLSKRKKARGERTTTTFWTSVVLDLIIDDHPDCIVRIGWETCTSNVTFGELQVSHPSSSEVRMRREETRAKLGRGWDVIWGATQSRGRERRI